MVSLAGIYVYPIKSLDGLAVDSATVGPGGSLARDRQFAMVDDDGEYVNGKRTPAVHEIRADFEPSLSTVTVDDGQRSATFALDGDVAGLQAWLDEHFEPSVSLKTDDELGYPDDTNDFGPTVISTGTLETVASWYDEVADAEEMRRRLRPNLVVDAEAFWEDHLYGAPDETVEFSVGSVTFEGTSPCQRCVVPTRHPDTGETIEGFQRTFVERREETLPSWANGEQFDHYFRVMVNTVTPEASRGGTLEVGDEVAVR